MVSTIDKINPCPDHPKLWKRLAIYQMVHLLHDVFLLNDVPPLELRWLYVAQHVSKRAL